MITGNYNRKLARTLMAAIIPYQVITGNYNKQLGVIYGAFIIPYQVITGNYNNITLQKY